ncbi:hypothetical protein ACLOJK_031137 [Asimina triloba]
MEYLGLKKKACSLQNTSKVVFLVLLTAVPVYHTLLAPFAWNAFGQSSPLLPPQTSSALPRSSSPLSSSWSLDEVGKSSVTITSVASPAGHNANDESSMDVVMTRSDKRCNIFKGEWVRNPEAPYYTNTTCLAISDRQNCMKHGRPDMDFLKWRWKPNGCDLPIFNAVHFLELVRGKSMAFVGDSLARNHMQSLICLLSKVGYPEDQSNSPDDRFKHLFYKSYNFTLASFWSPHLVRTKEADQPLDVTKVYLDKPDDKWMAQINQFNYVIISAGHWFFHPLIFYEGNRIVGCHGCSQKNVPDWTMDYGYRKALRTAFRAMKSDSTSKSNRRTVFLRTFSPAHYENGMWNHGGRCGWARPLKSSKTRLEGSDMGLYIAQLKEFKVAKKKGRSRGLNYRLLDTTKAMLMRPDGHPGPYGHPRAENYPYHDCSHWCLPGPIDAWNDFLLHMMKMDGG